MILDSITSRKKTTFELARHKYFCKNIHQNIDHSQGIIVTFGTSRLPAHLANFLFSK
jgi:hypothetical protein